MCNGTLSLQPVLQHLSVQSTSQNDSVGNESELTLTVVYDTVLALRPIDSHQLLLYRQARLTPSSRSTWSEQLRYLKPSIWHAQSGLEQADGVAMGFTRPTPVAKSRCCGPHHFPTPDPPTKTDTRHLSSNYRSCFKEGAMTIVVLIRHACPLQASPSVP